MNTLLDLCIQDQCRALEAGLGIPEDLRELALEIRNRAARHIEFAQDRLQEPKQSEDYYRLWQASLEIWRKALRLSDPNTNIYLHDRVPL